MSRALTKSSNKNEISTIKKTNGAVALREVNVPAQTSDVDPNNIITAYKDLDEPLKAFARNQNRHLIIAFVFFIVLGLGMLMGQHFNKKRAVATANLNALIPVGAETTTSEHYYYDKSCYKGENGEQVCMTRTSQQR